MTTCEVKIHISEKFYLQNVSILISVLQGEVAIKTLHDVSTT